MELIRSTVIYKDEHTPPPALLSGNQRFGSFPPTTMNTHIIENRSGSHAGSAPPSCALVLTDDSMTLSDPELIEGTTRHHKQNGTSTTTGESGREPSNDADLYAPAPHPINAEVCVTGGTEDSTIPPEDDVQISDPIEEALRVEAGLDILGGGMRRMVDLVNRLRASGIEDLGLPLPRIAVVGNQSAGKSSLIEAISGIKVPRYTGTCTRCPLEINLSESGNPNEAWHCRISLRFKKRYDPSLAAQPSRSGPNARSDRTRGSPWVDQATEQVPFFDITDKNQVERVLVAAQRAVLNPSRHWREYVDELRPEAGSQQVGRGGGGGWGGFRKKKTVDPRKNAEEDFEVKFSPNVVCMEITGQDLPNLAFIDLPGVIQTTESESEHYLIDLVTGLVKEYVQEEDCLIMLAMTMKDDAVNQSAARLAREFGEERTIGALTKPDTVGPGEYEQWINILRGNSHRLKHGYFVTKQPNQEQLVQGIDHAQARAQEADFFQNTEPWKTELQDLSHRFGTQALQSYLAKELGELIRKRLPGIIENIKNQHADVKEQLTKLPPPPTHNQTIIVYNLIRDLDSLVDGNLMGGPGRNTFQQQLRITAETFQRALRSVRPSLVVLETQEEELDLAKALETPHKSGQASANGRGNRRFGDRDRELSPSLRKARGNRGVEVHSLSSGEDNGGTRPKKRRGAGELMTPVSKKVKNMMNGGNGHKFNLPQIRHIIESTATARIPGQVDPTAVTNLIKQSIQLWGPIVSDFLNKCGVQLNKEVEECFTRVFEGYKKSPIYDEVYMIIQQLVIDAFEEQKAIVQRLMALEEEQIYTLNNDDYQKYIESHQYILFERRKRNLGEQTSRAAAATQQQAAQEDERAGGTPRKRKPQPQQQQQSGDETPDPYRKEIEVLAQVRAYSEVAQKRFVDMVYMSIQGEYINNFRKCMFGRLHTGLRLDDPGVAEICTELLIEDPQKEKRRKELIGKCEQLERAMDELSRLW